MKANNPAYPVQCFISCKHSNSTLKLIEFFSRMLYTIVAVFLFCSIPRFALNVVELVSVWPWYYSKYFSAVPATEEASCLRMPPWSHVVSHISSLLMTLNASTGFWIYCVACQTFREELRKLLKRPQALNRQQSV